ncbi:hypothetical protein [uncultured Litoreibacter sp.]|uniref:hypothetical protein n=1 Tax=uncultured Litoreibacter sp. TaxID=1392394 RepID=UPI002610D3F7|nr:hypothetical protein [uncultured Litoreibacter sp.]
MIIDRRHIHILEVISVILFSVFGSYLVAVDPAFNKNVTVSEVVRLFSVLASGALLYFAVFRMKKIDEEAKIDFHSETNLAKKAENSIDERYRAYFAFERTSIILRLSFSILFFAIFVSLEFWSPGYSHLFEHSLYGESSPAIVDEPGQATNLQETPNE